MYFKQVLQVIHIQVDHIQVDHIQVVHMQVTHIELMEDKLEVEHNLTAINKGLD